MLSAQESNFPLENSAGFFIPALTIFRNGHEDKYSAMAAPFTVPAIAVAAPSKAKPEPERPGVERMCQATDALALQRSIFSALRIAVDQGFDVVVFPALGCYGEGCPPIHAARIFQRVLAQYFEGCFRAVIFAVPHGPAPLGVASMTQASASAGSDYSSSSLHEAGSLRLAQEPFPAFAFVFLGTTAPPRPVISAAAFVAATSAAPALPLSGKDEYVSLDEEPQKKGLLSFFSKPAGPSAAVLGENIGSGAHYVPPGLNASHSDTMVEFR